MPDRYRPLTWLLSMHPQARRQYPKSTIVLTGVLESKAEAVDLNQVGGGGGGLWRLSGDLDRMTLMTRTPTSATSSATQTVMTAPHRL